MATSNVSCWAGDAPRRGGRGAGAGAGAGVPGAARRARCPSPPACGGGGRALIDASSAAASSAVASRQRTGPRRPRPGARSPRRSPGEVRGSRRGRRAVPAPATRYGRVGALAGAGGQLECAAQQHTLAGPRHRQYTIRSSSRASSARRSAHSASYSSAGVLFVPSRCASCRPTRSPSTSSRACACSACGRGRPRTRPGTPGPWRRGCSSGVRRPCPTAPGRPPRPPSGSFQEGGVVEEARRSRPSVSSKRRATRASLYAFASSAGATTVDPRVARVGPRRCPTARGRVRSALRSAAAAPAPAPVARARRSA